MMDAVMTKARHNPQVVAFPEACEEKILLAARQAADDGLCRALFVGVASQVRAAAEDFGVSTDGFLYFDTGDAAALEALIQRYLDAPGHPELSRKSLVRKSRDALNVALMLEAVGDARCTFAGLTHTTGEVFLAGQSIIGLQEGVSTLSSIGIFDIPGYQGAEGQTLAFGDSAICTDPTAEELCDIAVTACETVHALLDWEPRCALLSFSTTGSSEHPMAEKVQTAVRLANERRPDLKIDGEFQLDAALNPGVAHKKVTRDSAVAGRANIIIWPDLNAGNIGVKLVQQFARANAYGPLLQGFAKIVCDCSRGAPVSELVGNIAISVVRAQAMAAKGEANSLP